MSQKYMAASSEFALPKLIIMPKPWPYSKKWIDKNIEPSSCREVVDEACGMPGAGDKLKDFFTYMIPRALEKVAIQNSLVDQLSSGKIEAHKLSRSDVDWQSGNTWARHFEYKAVLCDAYNVERCGGEIQDAISFVWDFFEAARKHAEELIAYIEFQSSEHEREKEELYVKAQRERDNRSKEALVERQASVEKWKSIDIVHSKVESGFLYVLSNDLMPGVFKIGFTASNPDNRAAQISRQYGLPSSFCVVKYWRTKDPYIVEQRVHDSLWASKKSGEFFEIDIESLIKIIDGLIIRED